MPISNLRKQREQLARQGLEILIRNKCITFTPPFTVYTSGKIGPDKVDCGKILKTPGDQYHAATLLHFLYQSTERIAPPPTTLITGGETIDWIYSNRVAELAHLPASMLYKNGGVRGAELKDQVITHIADVNSAGSSVPQRWLPIITREGGTLKQVVFFVERNERGREVLKEKGIIHDSVVTLDGWIWAELKHRSVINGEEYHTLSTYHEDMNAWALETLRSDAGLAYLAKLMISEKPQEKKRAEDVLLRGYPSVAEELMDKIEPLAQLSQVQKIEDVKTMATNIAATKRFS